MFTVQYRQIVRTYILDLAHSDDRIISAAVIGSFASGKEDQWSDIDLTFGIDERYSIDEVLDDWSKKLLTHYSAVRLFDIKRESTIYRVFLLPGCLQVDISFTPASQFTSIGPSFKLLFGPSAKQRDPTPQSAEELFGYAVHHSLRARFCIERGRLWNAAYWIGTVRDYSLSIACLHHGLTTAYGKGYDDLPPEVRSIFRDTFVIGPEKNELLRCLRAVIQGLLAVSGAVKNLPEKVSGQLNELTQ